MDICGICGAFYSSEPFFIKGKRAFICPACREYSRNNLFSVCPECGYASWLNTDQTLPGVCFAKVLCPGCLKEFHTIDGMKRRK
jgi:hypothetical protein